MYLPYHAGVDECYGIELYTVNMFHGRPFKEETTASMSEHQIWKLLITSPVHL